MNKQRGRHFGHRRQELADLLPNLRRFAVSLAGNLPDADDLLQSTVERLLERGLPDDAALLPWAMKVCRNMWIDEIRARTVREKAVDDPALGPHETVTGEQQATGTVHAVACRRDGGWQTEVLSIDRQAVQDPAGPYQLASSTTPPAVSGVIDSLIGAGAPLDAPAESALIDRGWQKNRDAME